ncbi:YgaB family protein [Bacillus sp. FJAT-47783]|uniref:YgaB family protein n=1 Tax=Bacillus sp. FJAT-47783 TaxID=2922712 RepID=UPI001FAE05C4|nr:YgaB family protein [Bacillus sp. FJAT-47783]
MNAVSRFDQLVCEQLTTMEKLLYVQSEIERCQQLQNEFTSLQNATKIEEIQNEIQKKKQELYEIQEAFQRQTEAVIKTYQLEHS